MAAITGSSDFSVEADKKVIPDVLATSRNPMSHGETDRIDSDVNTDTETKIIEASVVVHPIQPKPKKRDPILVERCNLLNMCKLMVKELIDSSLKHGRMIDDDHLPLQQFFVVLEHIFRHNIKPKKGILRDKREFWPVLEQIEKYQPDARDITTSVRDMPNIKTSLGRSRAWLRLALMQKKLSDYFRVLVENKEDFLSEVYEPGAMMLEDEAMVIGGLLVGLNVIDCNFNIKDEDLDQPMGVIDFSIYLRDSQRLNDQSPENDQNNEKMSAILDQKNYLEELNRHLTATVNNLQQKLEVALTANTLMKEDLAIAKNNILTLQNENSSLVQEKETLSEDHKKKIEAHEADIHVERETYQTSRQGLDSLCQELQQKLREETQMRLDVEKELEIQISMKQEMEMGLKLLEKDVNEKHDTIATLRTQLDEIKNINVDMYKKMQNTEGTLQHKTDLVGKLEEKTQQMASTIKDMESKARDHVTETHALEETTRKLAQQIVDKDAKRCTLETDLKIEREWRGTLQRSLEQEKEKISKLLTDIQQYKEGQKEHEALHSSYRQLQEKCSEQETALAELGSHLSESKLKMEDLRQVQLAIKEASWTDDKDVKDCRQCKKAFSVSRRKHHCRNCGEIYCNECSDNKMPLPSSAKPVRVCDSCQTMILQRSSAQ